MLALISMPEITYAKGNIRIFADDISTDDKNEGKTVEEKLMEEVAFDAIMNKIDSELYMESTLESGQKITRKHINNYSEAGGIELIDIPYYEPVIRIPKGYQPTYEEWNKISSDSYLYTLLIAGMKKNGWQKNAILGTLCYIIAEGRNWGFYTYENYWAMPDPSGHVYPFGHTDISWTPVFDNDIWLNWLSPETIRIANESGYTTSGIGAGGILSQSDLFSYDASTGSYVKWGNGATELIIRAEKLNLDFHDPVFQVSLAVETIEGKIAFSYLNNSTLSEYDHNIGDNDWRDPRTFNGSTEEYAKIICATIGHSGAYIDASGEIRNFPYASHWNAGIQETAEYWYDYYNNLMQ